MNKFVIITFVILIGFSSCTSLREESPLFTDISVHDPSVIVADGQYYVFGSHLSVGKTEDLQNWTRVADGVNSKNPIFEDVRADLSETLIWAKTRTLWAPDVRFINGKYMMYYCACEGRSPLSALGIASSDSIEGPYTDEGIIFRSGMKGISDDGTPYDATVHPNAVDPAVFYDKEGRLWMIYGSYSGGIFIVKLNPENGFPLPDQGYGKHLLGGNHARIEGSFVIYSPETEYYYMFVSYGGLDANGGYNIRVSRSVNPDGPYYDANGTDMSTVKGAEGSFFDDESIAPHGVKLMGNFLLDGIGPQSGYVSPGHNSALYDKDIGKYLLFFHTRFPGWGETHSVRVHEFFFNSQDWPVISPLRYAIKNKDRDAVPESDIAGSYQVINHGKEISSNTKRYFDIFLENGLITGDQTGSYSYTEDSCLIKITIDGILYHGVVSNQWNEARSRFEVTFTSLSEDGTAVWGIKSN